MNCFPQVTGGCACKEMLEVPQIAINPQIQEGGGGGEKDKKWSYFLRFSKKSSLGSIGQSYAITKSSCSTTV